MGISDIAAGLEARGPSSRVGFRKDRHAFEVFRLNIVAMPIDDVAEGAILKGAFPSAA